MPESSKFLFHERRFARGPSALSPPTIRILLPFIAPWAPIKPQHNGLICRAREWSSRAHGNKVIFTEMRPFPRSRAFAPFSLSPWRSFSFFFFHLSFSLSLSISLSSSLFLSCYIAESENILAYSSSNKQSNREREKSAGSVIADQRGFHRSRRQMRPGESLCQ